MIYRTPDEGRPSQFGMVGVKSLGSMLYEIHTAERTGNGWTTTKAKLDDREVKAMMIAVIEDMARSTANTDFQAAYREAVAALNKARMTPKPVPPPRDPYKNP